MTDDDIIRMAREAGWTEYSLLHAVEVQRLETFAALVAAAEREACAKVCERLPETFKIAADEFGYEPETPTAENYAAAIRTRDDT